MNHCRQGTQIEWRYKEDGEKVRISLRTGRIIPLPISSEETIDYKSPKLYKDQLKDTSKADAEKVTFAVCNVYLKKVVNNLKYYIYNFIFYL